eukprot:s4187_g2.t1
MLVTKIPSRVRLNADAAGAVEEVVSDADAARRSEDLRQQAQEELQRAQGSGVPQLPLSQLEQNRSTLIVSATDAAQNLGRPFALQQPPNEAGLEMGELSSRSLGKISATRSEVLRDVFDTAAISLVADIVDESLLLTEEAARAKAKSEEAEAAALTAAMEVALEEEAMAKRRAEAEERECLRT